MTYLVGPGRANEHTNPHIVAASPVIERRWGNWDSLSRAQGEEIAEYLDQFMMETGTVPRGRRDEFDPSQGRVVARSAVPNHVFHASLSLGPDEGELSDEQWGKIAKRFMEEMGFDDGLESPCRWVAVRHGKSKNGAIISISQLTRCVRMVVLGVRGSTRRLASGLVKNLKKSLA